MDLRVYIALDDSPEHAAALGRMLGHWGLLEYFLARLMGFFLDIDRLKADIIFKEIVSFKAKLNLLRRFNHHSTKNELRKKEIDTLLSTAEGLNKKRNSFIHASWFGDSNNLYRSENSLEGSYKKMHKPLLRFTAQDIENVVEDIAILSASLDDLLFRLLKDRQVQP